MENSLKVLVLEDNPTDAALVVREMKRAGFDLSVTYVDSAEGYKAQLDGSFDLILADYSLPQFGAPQALAILRERQIDIPFIVVTGTASEEEVVECMRGGAADYLLKDRLARLGQAVSMALAARKDRAERARAAHALKRRDAILEAVSHTVSGLLYAVDWKAELERELSRLGAAAEVENVSVLRLGTRSEDGLDQDGADILSQRQFDAMDSHPLEARPHGNVADVARWRAMLASGSVQSFALSELPESEQKYFEQFRVESVLVAPVFSGSELWGALVFGERASSRDWAGPEIGALETAARILGAVVHRERVSVALQQSEETTWAILRSMPDLIFRIGVDAVVLDHRQPDGRTPPIPAAHFIGRSLQSIFPGAANDFGPIVGAVLTTGDPFIAERVFMAGDSGRLYELRLVRNGDYEALAIARDITERDRAEQRTRALNAAMNVLAQTERVPQMISRMLEVLGDELGWDVAAYWSVNAERQALTFVEMWHRDPASTATFEAAAKRLSILEGSGMIGRVWKSQEPLWMEDVQVDPTFVMPLEAQQTGIKSALAFAVSTGSGVYGVIKLLCRNRRTIDVNLVKAAESLGMQIGQFMERSIQERQVSESEARFRTMADMAPVLIWMSDVTGACTFANRPWLDFTGATLSETLESRWLDSVHPDDRDRTRLTYASAADERHSYQLELRVLRHDGEYCWVLFTGVPRFDAHGDFVGYIGSGLDVTDKMIVEKKLRLEQQFVQALLDTIDVGIVACNADGELTLMNRATREFLGLTDGIVTHDDWAEAEKLYHADATTPIGRDMHPLMRALRGELVRNVEVSIRSDPENPRILLTSGQRIVGPRGETSGAVVALQDVTSERLLEDQFRQAHKMEAVGRLAGGVAHDFNNILTVITGYGEMLKLRLGGSEHLLQFAEEILGASSRAASLTRQLLAFSRKQILQPRSVALNDLLKNLHQMLGRLIGEDIELRVSMDPSVGSIFADPGQIEQVVINLVVNARDAMPDGGTLVLATATVELDQCATEELANLRPGRYHVVTVSDTGCGMTPETLSHIYEPFFTTKGADRGTGLGLATVYGIVQQSNGVIFATSELNVGSVFKVCFPEHVGAAEHPTPEDGSDAHSPHGETILVVEDDRAVRGLVCGALRNAGYSVVEAENGEEALALCATHNGPIDLVLTDMVMPKMSGFVLSQRLAERLPNLKVLFMSGYTHDSLSAEQRSDPMIAILEKPFSRGDLTRAVRQALRSED